jgi:aminopeptidase N
MSRTRRKGLLTATLVVAAVVIAWVGYAATQGSTDPGVKPSTSPSNSVPAESHGVDTPDEQELQIAVSEPHEDSYYPRTGDPGVDVLHYALDLTWDPDETTLTGVATVTLRAAADADQFQLDLGAPLVVSAVEVDGTQVPFEHTGKDLVISTPVVTDQRYTARIAYAGIPEPVPAPTTRSDFSTSGWTITKTNEVWTMQEPFGAYSWYPVNDQPADKALYDFTISVPDPWVGIANGTMTSREVVDGNTVTTFQLVEPAASYLTTISIGDYDYRGDETASGVPLNYWALRSQKGAFKDLAYAKDAIEWIEGKLGPYPFSSAGIVLTESDSGMETQTLLTLGDNPYIRSREVIVHEMVHQWYGDLITPTDWRDVWMNEGMTMYLQLVYRAEHDHLDIDDVMAEVAAADQGMRDQAGAPGAYNPEAFGEGNIYYPPALMWHELRRKIGDQTFWRLTREWPRQHAFGNATRDEWFDWLEAETGRELTRFFDAWVLGTKTPPHPATS